MERRRRPLADAFFTNGEKVKNRTRLLLVSLVAWACAAGVAFAVPARPLYEPEAVQKPALAFNLAGTMWQGTLFLPNSKVTFHADGTLLYGDVGSGSPGTWKLEGNQLQFQINNYSEYKTVINGNAIEGVGWNKAGDECNPKLYRAEAIAPQIQGWPVLPPRFKEVKKAQIP